MGVEDITCTASNHKFRLMAFGRQNSEGVVYSIDETTGGLEISHRLVLPTKDYPGCPGPVTGLRYKMRTAKQSLQQLVAPYLPLYIEKS